MSGSGFNMSKIDPLVAVGAIAIICSVIYWIFGGNAGPLELVIIAFLIIFSVRALVRDMNDDKAKTEGSESYDCDFEDPAEIKLICPKHTFGTNPFYIYCDGKCIAKISRGDELIVKVPRGRVNLGIIRIKDMVPNKYLYFDTERDFVVYVYPDKDDSMLAYRLYAPIDETVDESVFTDYYQVQKSGSVRISIGVLIGAIIISIVLLVFFRPF